MIFPDTESLMFLNFCFFQTVMSGLIYILSALVGTLVAALFVEKRPSVGSSGPLFGLLGATLSALIQNWDMCTNKVSTFCFSPSVLSMSHDLI